MNTQIIIYGSRYGSARRYAERLAELTGLDVVDHKEAKEIGGYDRIVYIGSLYAGGVTGLKQTVSKMPPQQELIVATVGLADPTDATNVAHIRQSIKSQIPAHFYDESRLFHLRGAIDYTKLNLKYRLMMSLLAKKVAKLPEEQQNAETRAMLETYGKQVDFVDFSSLQPIVDIIK
jgi:menaquinone-dependent protoporphyrinogen IX oxidase